MLVPRRRDTNAYEKVQVASILDEEAPKHISVEMMDALHRNAHDDPTEDVSKLVTTDIGRECSGRHQSSRLSLQICGHWLVACRVFND